MGFGITSDIFDEYDPFVDTSYEGSTSPTNDNDDGGSIFDIFSDFDYGKVFETVATYGILDILDIDSPQTGAAPAGTTLGGYDDKGNPIYIPKPTAQPAPTNYTPYIIGLIMLIVVVVVLMKVL